MLVATGIGFSGPIYVISFIKKINKRLKLDLIVFESGNFGLGYIHQADTILILSFSTVGIGWFIIMYYVLGEPILFSVLAGIFTSLPMLGIGLRYHTFHEKNRYVNDEEVAGYPPQIYLLANLIICWVGYDSLLFINSLQIGIVVFVICTFCYIWIVFPDKINKYLPFDNKTSKGMSIYLGFIIVLFIILMKGFIPPEIMDVIVHLSPTPVNGQF